MQNIRKNTLSEIGKKQKYTRADKASTNQHGTKCFGIETLKKKVAGRCS